MKMGAKSWWDGDFPLMCCLLTTEPVTAVRRQIYASSADCNCFKSAALLTDTDKVLLAAEDTLSLTDASVQMTDIS